MKKFLSALVGVAVLTGMGIVEVTQSKTGKTSQITVPIVDSSQEQEGVSESITGVEGVQGVKGIFALGNDGQGWRETSVTACPANRMGNLVNADRVLCRAGEAYETLDSTWADPDVVGAYVRLPWSAVQLAPGTDDDNFDFSALDRELDQAVRYGKKISLSFGAGADGTPLWLREAGIQTYVFQDGGSDLAAGSCGRTMTLGNPTDLAYQAEYFNLIRKAGEHIQTTPDWFDAIAYFKISGANLFTHEMRLPNRCMPGCICNSEVWSEAGYTPEGMAAFVANQMAVIQEALPGKPMVYQVIQDGLPDIGNDGATTGSTVVRSTDQLDEILNQGSDAYGPLFVVAHNGLGTVVLPNPWVVRYGNQGQPTGFQTRNPSEIRSGASLQSALENLWDNTTAQYLEVYEEVLWKIRAQGELVDDSVTTTNTLAEWNDLLQTR